MFTRSAITPPKVHRLGWNLEHCQGSRAGPSRLYCSRRCTQVTHWQAPASSERRCSCRHNTRKHDHGLSELLHDELHWLDIPQRVDYKLCVTVHRCLQRKAPPYLADLCTPVSDIASRRHLRLTRSNQLDVPRHRRTQFGRRAFSVAGPMAWNAVPDSIRYLALSTCSFRRYLKTLSPFTSAPVH